MDIFSFTNMVARDDHDKFNDFEEDETGNLYFYNYRRNDMEERMEKYFVDMNDYSFFMSADDAKMIKSIDIRADDEVKHWKSVDKYPRYSLRGPRISADRAFDIIRKTDDFFRRIYAYISKKKKEEYVGMVNFDNRVFEEDPHNWIHPNGVVGFVGNTGKYPDIYELLLDFFNLKLNFPYLDLIVVLDEHLWSLGEFERITTIGVWLHENKIEFLNPENALAKYNEYVKLYEEEDKSEYGSDPDARKKHRVNMEYLRKYLEAWGLEPDETLDKIKEEHHNMMWLPPYYIDENKQKK